jgi:hypothetical protein
LDGTPEHLILSQFLNRVCHCHVRNRSLAAKGWIEAFQMKAESKLARQKKAARKVAEIMYASLQQFSQEEQEKRIKEIHKIAMKTGAKPSRKPSKRSSTRENLEYSGLPQQFGKNSAHPSL